MTYLIGPEKEVKLHIERSVEGEDQFRHLTGLVKWNALALMSMGAMEDELFVAVAGSIKSSPCRELISAIRSKGIEVSVL
jgi:hypothetical protein